MKQIWLLSRYIQRGVVKKIQPDFSKMKQMKSMAHIREEFLEESIDEKFIALHLEAYHDIIAELITAHLYKDGLICRTGDSLLAYAFRYFPFCNKNKSMLLNLFILRQKIHALKPCKIKKFLDKNHIVLHAIIQELKKV